MSGRDRAVLILAIVAAVLVGVWLEVVSPERHKASSLAAQVSSAKTQLESAESQVSGAHEAQSQYAAAYAAMVNLGKAVPAREEVSSLIDQLTRASSQKSVDFESIASGSSSSSAAASSSSSADGSASVFTPLPFSFTFEGTYFDLEHLFRQLTDFTTLGSAGNIEVSGRLLTISSVTLTPVSSTTEGSKVEASRLTGSISATAYVLPESHSVSSSSSPSSSAGSAASPSAGGAASSAPTPAAIVKVDP